MVEESLHRQLKIEQNIISTNFIFMECGSRLVGIIRAGLMGCGSRLVGIVRAGLMGCGIRLVCIVRAGLMRCGSRLVGIVRAGLMTCRTTHSVLLCVLEQTRVDNSKRSSFKRLVQWASCQPWILY